MTRIMKDLTTIKTKAFGNPVQMDTEHLFLFRTASFGSSTSLRSLNMEKERKMRQKTAHIGRKASFASQGKKFTALA